jgi:quercetin dioxygenase-like cupin family protein
MDKKIVHLYTGTDNKSHFEELALHLDIKLGKGKKAETVEASGITVWEKGSHQPNEPLHNAPHRQIMIILDGHTEMEVSDGSKHQFHPGDILFVEDTSGEGHYTRSLDGRPRKSVIITLD